MNQRQWLWLWSQHIGHLWPCCTGGRGLPGTVRKQLATEEDHFVSDSISRDFSSNRRVGVGEQLVPWCPEREERSRAALTQPSVTVWGLPGPFTAHLQRSHKDRAAKACQKNAHCLPAFSTLWAPHSRTLKPSGMGLHLQPEI